MSNSRICALRSGSSGNAIFIQNNSTSILVDAGVNGKTVEQALRDIDADASSISCILITHEHRDHIAGAGVLARRFNLPIYVNEETWNGMSSIIGRIDPDLVHIIECGRDYTIGDLSFRSFDISHDTERPVGYRINLGKADIAVCTDTGTIDEELLHNLEGSKAVFIEANYDQNMLDTGMYPYFLKKRISGINGHLSNDECARVVCELAKTGTEQFILSHLSKDNNMPDLARLTVLSKLRACGIDLDFDNALTVAARYDTSKPFCF